MPQCRKRLKVEVPDFPARPHALDVPLAQIIEDVIEMPKIF